MNSAFKEFKAHILGIEPCLDRDRQYRAVCAVAEVLVADDGDVIALANASKDIVDHGLFLKRIVTEDQRLCSLEDALMFKHSEPF